VIWYGRLGMRGTSSRVDSDEARAARARGRATWPVRKLALGEEPSEDLRSSTTAEERLAMVWPLTVDAWRLAGREIPDYPRHAAPGRVVRPGSGADRDGAARGRRSAGRER
jgi:hypothetical protein